MHKVHIPSGNPPIPLLFECCSPCPSRLMTFLFTLYERRCCGVGVLSKHLLQRYLTPYPRRPTFCTLLCGACVLMTSHLQIVVKMERCAAWATGEFEPRGYATSGHVVARAPVHK